MDKTTGQDFIEACKHKRATSQPRMQTPFPMAPLQLPKLPQYWAWTSLSEICERVSVGHVGITSKFFDNTGNGIRFVRSQDVRPGRLMTDNAISITKEFHQKLKKSQLKSGDVLIVRVGANRGDVCIVPDGIGELNCANIVFARPMFPNRFIEYYLRSSFGQDVLLSMTTGAAQGVINTQTIAAMPIPIPPRPTQQRIADILSAYDELIENNTRRIRILEQIAQAVYQEWFGRVDKETMPEGWKMATIEDYGDVITGKTPSKAVDNYWNSRDVPFIRTPDMHNQFYCIETTDYVSVEGANSQKKAFIPPNSLCVSCIGTVGIVTITPVRAQTNQQINSVVLNDLSDLEFLYFELLGLKEILQRYAAVGATMANLSKGKFMSVNVQCPPKELREKFHAAASPMFEQIKNLQYKNAKLRQTRDLLLPRLVSGEIELQ
ncbi:MAG: restriction endonuclease subunit S [Anaerolineales bacterium]